MAEGGGEGYTVEEALSTMGFGRFQAMAIAYAGVGYASEAMELMLLSFIGNALQVQWNLTSNQESLISSVVFAGMLIGAYSFGLVSDTFGRRKGFLLTASVTGGAGFLCAFAPNYGCLIFLRFIAGIGLGGGHVLLAWFLEFVPTPTRGTWMIVIACFWPLGTLLEASLAWAIMPTLGWRCLLALSALPSFILLLFYRIVPESPRYLTMKGKTNDAMLVLEKVSMLNNKPLPSGELISKPKVELADKLHSPENEHLLPINDRATKDGDFEFKGGGINALYWILSPTLIKSTLLLWINFFGNAFAYFGLVLLTSELVMDRRCSGKLNSVQLRGTNPYKDVFITSFAEFPGFLLAVAIVDRLGRKLSMLFMLCACGIFLVPLARSQSEVVTTVLLFGARICITGSINTLYAYAPEVYPTSVRSTGFGIAVSVGRIGGILCPLVAVVLVEGCRQTEAVVLFELVIGFSALAVFFFPSETKGRELSDSISN